MGRASASAASCAASVVCAPSDRPDASSVAQSEDTSGLAIIMPIGSGARPGARPPPAWEAAPFAAGGKPGQAPALRAREAYSQAQEPSWDSD